MTTKKCKNCNGTGDIVKNGVTQINDCRVCHGTGRIRTRKKYTHSAMYRFNKQNKKLNQALTKAMKKGRKPTQPKSRKSKKKTCKHLWMPKNGYQRWVDGDPAHCNDEKYWTWKTLYCVKCFKEKKLNQL